MELVERLNVVINELERELQRVQEELETKQDLDTWGWTRHTEIEEKNDDLPVPRLEMECRDIDDAGYNYEWTYSMVYKHALGHHVRIPLGRTLQGGRISKRTTDDLPFREGINFKHDQHQFGWPAFVIINGLVSEWKPE